MCKKLTFLISLCLLVGLTGTTFAQGIGWDDGGADHLWNTAENWIGDEVPTSEDEVRIGMQDPNGAVIDASHTGANKAVAFWCAVGHQDYGDGDMNMTGGELEVTNGMTVGNENIGNLITSGGTISTLEDRFAVGRGYDFDGHGTLIMTGGTINLGSYMCIGWLGKGIGVVDMTSGTLDVKGTLFVGHNDGDGSLIMKGGTIDAKVLQIGNMSGSIGDVNMVGGTINIKNAINVGNKSGSTGTLTMTGGQISADADKKGSGNLIIGNNGSAGHVQLDGGTFYADNLTIRANDTMDITGGTLILKGNDVEQVDGYAAAGKITGGGQSDPRYVYRKYDSTTDETTVKYDPDGPKFASDEKPKDHAGVGEAPPLPFRLSWSPGDGAVTHDVYFGTNETAVTDANRANPLGVLVSKDQVEEYYDVDTVVKDTIYYWRIDEVSNPSIWKGRIWQFSTEWRPIVDDFENYFDNSDLWNTWNDGFENGTSSTASLATNQAYKGKQSMKVIYENDFAPYYSEVDRDVNDPNWEKIGFKALSLWFRGQSANDAKEQMYLALEDSSGNSAKVLYDGDQNDLLEASWHRWDIALQRFNDINGVVLTDVNRITIGFGDGNDPSPGGFGEGVWFDEIQLVRPRCIKDADGLTPDGRFAGWNSGCVVDNAELEIMADDWVLSEHNVTAVAPSDANLEAYYEFEENLEDSSGNLRNGSPNDPYFTLTYDTGKAGMWALELDGTNYVDIIGYKGVTGPNSRTCCAWIKTPQTTNGEILYWGYNTLGHKWEILIEDGRLQVEVHGGSRAGSTDVDDGQWHHVAVVLVDDGSPNVKEAKLYVDGVREVISSQSAEPVDTYSVRDVKIGQGNNDYYFDGLIDEVRIYSRILSQAEIVYLAKGPGGEVFQPLPPLLSTLNNDTDLYDDESIDFKDFAELADVWLKNQLWPE